ncbi:hypothetical protein SD77_1477 [Bacillus badius]|uniref:Uncharacterized protein n=1 Tax=Bacillus badius TaxID=1455 RepID=A0ABR5AT32_BACBA|nr:hypothetical protein SD77_1477 [Bacillus badius]
MGRRKARFEKVDNSGWNKGRLRAAHLEEKVKIFLVTSG